MIVAYSAVLSVALDDLGTIILLPPTRSQVYEELARSLAAFEMMAKLAPASGMRLAFRELMKLAERRLARVVGSENAARIMSHLAAAAMKEAA